MYSSSIAVWIPSNNFIIQATLKILMMMMMMTNLSSGRTTEAGVIDAHWCGSGRRLMRTGRKTRSSSERSLLIVGQIMRRRNIITNI